VSTNFNIRPVGKPVTQSANNAVATELPASQSVNATAADARVGNDPDGDLTHQTFPDRAAAPMVYRVADNRTSLVMPFSDESILRRRAYFRTLDLTKRAPARRVVTDRTV
jgi:hypothetical protein